jgi:Uma2 family endonuclease
MATIIHDRILQERLQAERAAAGADRYDEVWEGDYVMAPMPNNEHQFLVARLTRILDEVITDSDRGIVLPGTNVSDRVEGWEHNYRVPDVAVFLKTTAAEDHGTFWLGGPDLAIEIVSTDDQTREKFDFYAKVGTRELLVVDRSPWQLELFRLSKAKLESAGIATPATRSAIILDTCMLRLEIESSEERPRITVTQVDDSKIWTI